MEQPVPETVRSAVVQVCRDAFHWRDDIRALFLGVGVPPALYDRYDQPEFSKAKIARAVLNDLQTSGANGRAAQRKVIEELCQMDRPHPDAPNQAKGRAALTELKRVATSSKVVVDRDVSAAQARRERAARQQKAQQQRQARLGALRDQFFGLLQERPRTKAERQQRGYALEALLADLFEAYDLQYRQRPRALLEDASGPRGGRNNIVLFDDRDLITIFEGRVTLPDALIEKVDAAEQEGRPWHPLGR